MNQNELELHVASQILQDPVLLQGLTIPIDEFREIAAKDCIEAVVKLEKDGLKITRADVDSYTPERTPRGRIANIWQIADTRANFQAHVKQLRDMLKREKLERLGHNILESVQKDVPDATIAKIEEYMATIEALGLVYEPASIGEVIKESIEALEYRMKNPGLPGVTTGYHELNKLFGGFEKRKLYYIGSRPSEGKTALMLNFVLRILDSNTPTGIVSVESSTKEIGDRLVSITGRINALDMRRGEIKGERNFKAIQQAAVKLYKKPGLVYHNPHCTILDVELQTRRMVKNLDAKVVFVDYVQLISGGKFRARHEEVAHISRRLKALASDAEVAIVALAQMRREVDGRKAGMGDFGESSALEKDADVMMAIHHEDRDGEEFSAIKVLKARDGLTGECQVRFIREYLTFEEERR